MSFLMPTIIIIIAPYRSLRYLIVLVMQHSIKSSTFKLCAATLSHHVAVRGERKFCSVKCLKFQCH